MNEVLMDEAEVLPLSEVMEVSFVAERSCETVFVLNETRKLLLVDSLQRDLVFSGSPDYSWPSGTGLTRFYSLLFGVELDLERRKGRLLSI